MSYDMLTLKKNAAVVVYSDDAYIVTVQKGNAYVTQTNVGKPRTMDVEDDTIGEVFTRMALKMADLQRQRDPLVGRGEPTAEQFRGDPVGLRATDAEVQAYLRRRERELVGEHPLSQPSPERALDEPT